MSASETGGGRPVSKTQEEAKRIWEEEGLTEAEAAELQSVLDMSLVRSSLALLVQPYKY
jgi:hypothetical protein